MAWLDEQQKASKDVLYVAFGSEVGGAECYPYRDILGLYRNRDIFGLYRKYYPQYWITKSKR